MVKSLPHLVLVAAAIASSGAAHAQSLNSDTDAPAAYRAAAFLENGRAGQSRPIVIRPLTGVFGPSASTGHTYASDDGSAAPIKGHSPTAVDYHLARDGPYGSIGSICLGGIAPIAPYEAAVTAGSDGGRLLGASLNFPLR